MASFGSLKDNFSDRVDHTWIAVLLAYG